MENYLLARRYMHTVDPAKDCVILFVISLVEDRESVNRDVTDFIVRAVQVKRLLCAPSRDVFREVETRLRRSIDGIASDIVLGIAGCASEDGQRGNCPVSKGWCSQFHRILWRGMS